MQAVFRSRALRESFLLLVIALVPALLAGFLHPKRPVGGWSQAHAVSLAQARAWGDRVLWIDALSSRRTGTRIPGALPLTESGWEIQLPEVLRAWKAGRPIMVICGGPGCEAGRRVAERLRRLGLRPVDVLKEESIP